MAYKYFNESIDNAAADVNILDFNLVQTSPSERKVEWSLDLENTTDSEISLKELDIILWSVWKEDGRVTLLDIDEVHDPDATDLPPGENTNFVSGTDELIEEDSGTESVEGYFAAEVDVFQDTTLGISRLKADYVLDTDGGTMLGPKLSHDNQSSPEKIQYDIRAINHTGSDLTEFVEEIEVKVLSNPSVSDTTFNPTLPGGTYEDDTWLTGEIEPPREGNHQVEVIANIDPDPSDSFTTVKTFTRNYLNIFTDRKVQFRPDIDGDWDSTTENGNVNSSQGSINTQ